MFGSFPLADGAHAEPADAGGVPAEWTSTSSADQSRVILYLHGGGYVSGSIASHRSMVSHLGVASDARALALGYRLAPEHPFPAACEDALAGYRFLVDSGFHPSRIVLAGEHASYIPAWQEGAILSALDAIERLHVRVTKA